MVRERAACLSCRGGFILDGFPRTLAQAESLKQLMETEQLPLSAVVNFELPLAEIVERLSGRRTCEKCKAVYHITRQPSQTAGACDRCGGRLYQREDDHEDTVRHRLQVYNNATKPLLDYYGKAGLLSQVDGIGRPEEILKRILEKIGNGGIAKATS